jgi:hypothetical protein
MVETAGSKAEQTIKAVIETVKEMGPQAEYVFNETVRAYAITEAGFPLILLTVSIVLGLCASDFFV